MSKEFLQDFLVPVEGDGEEKENADLDFGAMFDALERNALEDADAEESDEATDEKFDSFVAPEVSISTLSKETCRFLKLATYVRGCYPLNWKEAFEDIGQDKFKVTEVNLSGDQFATDAVLYILLKNKQVLTDVKEINLNGSIHLTDRGLYWLAQLIPSWKALSSIHLDGCHKITEKGLQYLCNRTCEAANVRQDASPLRVHCCSTDTAFQPEVDADSVQFVDLSTNPLLDQTSDDGGSLVYHPHSKLVIINHLETSFLKALTSKELVRRQSLEYQQEWSVGQWRLSVIETDLDHPACEMLAKTDDLTQVVVPINPSAEVAKTKTFLMSVLLYFITKEVAREGALKTKAELEEHRPGIRFLLVAVSKEEKHFSPPQFEKLRKALTEETISMLGQRADELQIQAGSLASNTDNLSFSLHEQYAQLIQGCDNLRAFCTDRDARLKLLTLNTKTWQGHQAIADHIEENKDLTAKHFPFLFNISPNLQRVVSIVMEARQQKILTLDEVREECDMQNSSINDYNHVYDKILKLMHSWGQVLYFEKADPPLVVTDPTWFLQTIQDIEQKATETAAADVRCLAPDTQLWADRTLLKNGLKTVDKDKMSLLLEILLSNNQVMKLPANRTRPTDVKFYLLHPLRLQEPPASVEKFLNPGLKEENLVRGKRVYSFPAGLARHTFTAVLSTCLKFCHPLLLWKQGMIWHQGAAEVILVMEDADKLKPEIRLDVKGWIPASQKGDKDEGNVLQSMRYHLWGVFNLYADMIDFVLLSASVPHTVQMESAKRPANHSICAAHNWAPQNANLDNFNLASRNSKQAITVCTVCNNCSGRGTSCDFNGIRGDDYRRCHCSSSAVACWDCGICKHCAKAIWDMKCFLRPSCETQYEDRSGSRRVTDKLSLTPVSEVMNSVTMNQVNFSLLKNLELWQQPTVCLTGVENRDYVVQVFPSHPVVRKKPQGKGTTLPKLAHSASWLWQKGDILQITLKEPVGNLLKSTESQKSTKDDKKKSVQYHFHIMRHVTVNQDMGTVEYHCSPGPLTTPVALVAALCPLTPEHPFFQIRIEATGEGVAIAVGLVPQDYPIEMMPGWGTQSVGYHADDGGLYEEVALPNHQAKPCGVSDVMGCGVDFNTKKGAQYMVYFTKNGKKVFELPFLKEGQCLYPAVGLKSAGAKIQLLSEEVWTERRGDFDAGETQLQKKGSKNTDQPFEDDWAKVRPSKFVRFPKPSRTGAEKLISKSIEESLAGMPSVAKNSKMALEDPSKLKSFIHLEMPRSAIAFKVSTTNSGQYLLVPDHGVEEHGGTTTITVVTTTARDPKDDLQKDKFSLKYAAVPSDKVQQFQENFQREWGNLPQHLVRKLNLQASWGEPERPKVKDVSQESDLDLDRLPSVTEGKIPVEPSYILEVKKNKRVVSEVYVPAMDYHIHMENTTNVSYESLIVSTPRLPIPSYAGEFQPGMQLMAELDPDQLDLEKLHNEINLTFKREAESAIYFGFCTIRHVTQDGATLTLQWDKDPEGVRFTRATDSPLIHPCDWHQQLIKRNRKRKKIQITRIMFHTHGKNRHSVFVLGPVTNLAPFYLFNEQQVGHYSPLEHKLPSPRQCSQETYLFTVQDCNLVNTAPTLKAQGCDIGYRGTPRALFLPKDVSKVTLMYPSLSDLMDLSNLAVHHFCKQQSESRPFWGHTDLMPAVYNRMHLMDVEGCTPKLPLKDESILVDRRISCAYAELCSTELRLQSLDNILTGVGRFLDRSKVEACLSEMIAVYTATSCAIAASYDGLLQLPSEGDLDFLAIPEDVCDNANPHSLTQGVCRAHGLTADAKDLSPFEHYGQQVNTLKWGLQPGELQVPAGFVDAVPNVEVLSLYWLFKVEELPHDFTFSRLRKLKSLCLEGPSELKHLPADIGECEDLRVLDTPSCQFEELPGSITQCGKLASLNCPKMMLKSLPVDFQALQRLTFLDLSSNPLMKLPKGFGNLKALKTLKLSGMQWMPKMASMFSDETHFMNSDNVTNSCLAKLVGVERMKELYHKAKDSYLDDREIPASINAQLFYLVPRFGHDFEEWDEDGGVPSDLFDLENLEHLSLSKQSLRFVPSAVKKLQKLFSLDLSNCVLLESLPSSMSLMSQLKTIHLRGCPSLRTPPQEIVSRGTEAVLSYLKRLGGGFTENWRTKLMLVGLGGAGKTSLLRALMSKDYCTEALNTQDITDGIDIQMWQVPTKDGHMISYSAWDFAGQTVYYNTHQFFLSNRAIYLLLWTTRLGFEHAGLEFWLSSIRCHAPKAPIFIIGTHCDQVPKAELPQAKLLKQYPQIRGFHFVSCITGQGIEELQNSIISTTLQESYMGERVPQVYLDLEKLILENRSQDTNVMPWESVCKDAISVGIFDEKDIQRAVQFLHDLGTVQYFDNEFLRDNIVINPQWIVDVMACVVSVKDSPIQDGRLNHQDISSLWYQFPDDLHEWLLRLTEAFDLTFPLSSQPVSLIPCLLPQHEPEYEWPAAGPNSETSETLMLYKFAYLPAGLFNRTQVRLFQFSDSEAIWKTGSLLKKNRHLALVTQPSPTELEVKVQGPRPQNILFLIHEVIESLVAEAFAGVTYDFLVPCPDCLAKSGTDAPSMFPASLIKDAIDWNTPYLQCRKYFHTVSMPILQAMLPPDSREDFDASLSVTMHALKDLRNTLSTDVFISYCAADVPTGGDLDRRVHPRSVKRDLNAAGFKCWYKDNMAEVPLQKKLVALQDSKVMLVFISSEYEKDEQCRRLFLYAVNTLSKPLVVVAVGKDPSWKETDLGLQIGDEVYANMRDIQKYDSELSKLKDFIQTRIARTGEGCVQSSRHPECFLSYCWSNSESASKGKGRANPKALGWGDPREIKKQLEKQGINCWLDIEQTGKAGLFRDINLGIKHADVIVACVSDEYEDSKNCMMELRFAACTLNKPIILAVVGTGYKWQLGEIGMLESRSQAVRVNFQTENPTAYDDLTQFIKERLPHDLETRTRSLAQEERSVSVASVTEISFQEEFELAQRKFLRHITTLSERQDTKPFPRLFVLDFKSQDLDAQGVGARPPSAHRPGSAQRGPDGDKPQRRKLHRRDTGSTLATDTLWKTESFCVRLLCEHDQGWHLTDATLDIQPVQAQYLWDNMDSVAPFLTQIYDLLQHTGIPLACLAGEAGDSFQESLQKSAEKSTIPLEVSHSFLKSQLLEDRESLDLARCHLPTGQIRWLCSEHQKANRVTVLSSVSYTVSRQPLVTDEDFLMKDFVHKYEAMRDPYRKRKGQRPPSSQCNNDGETDRPKAVRKSKEKTGATQEPKRPTSSRKGQKPEGSSRPGSASALSRSSSRSSTNQRHREMTTHLPAGSEARLKVAGQLARANTTWPGQPTSRACVLL